MWLYWLDVHTRFAKPHKPTHATLSFATQNLSALQFRALQTPYYFSGARVHRRT
jgi:hypothetical protein